MELLRLDSGSQLVTANFDAGTITEGQILSISMETPIEDVYEIPLALRLYADSTPGSSVTPLVNSQTVAEGFALSVNGIPAAGMLCFSAEGTDYIWTGLHYWLFASILGAILLVLMLCVWNQTCRFYNDV